MTLEVAQNRAGLRVIHVGNGLATGSVEGVYLVVWRANVTRERFEIERAGLLATAERHRRRTAFLCVIEPTSEPPDSELNRAASAMLKAVEDDLLCVAAVIEGHGFRAAMVRAVLSTISLLIGSRRYDTRVHDNVAAGCVWVAGRTDVPALQLQSAVEELRGMLEAAR